MRWVISRAQTSLQYSAASWRAWRGAPIDDAHLGVVGVEAQEQVGVLLLASAPKGLEVEPSSGLLFGHIAFSPPFL
jgi:hypothetical protein